MKTFILLIFCGFLTASNPIKDDCTCRGIKLYGDVKIVERAADFNVETVDRAANLDVQKVNYPPQRCGEWRFVTRGEDFTIQLVTRGADFSIQYVDRAPGLRP